MYLFSSNRVTGLILMLFIAGELMVTKVDAADVLEANISIDKNRLSLGEQTTITGSIKNISSQNIYVLKRNHPYTFAHMQMFTGIGAPLKTFKLKVFGLIPVGPSDFTELKPGDTLNMMFSGVLKKKKILDIEKAGRVIVEGVFLDFEDSALLIPAPGKYSLKFQYEIEPELQKQWGNEFHLNLWGGTIVSPTIEIFLNE